MLQESIKRAENEHEYAISPNALYFNGHFWFGMAKENYQQYQCQGKNV